jgi:hypothetical protein
MRPKLDSQASTPSSNFLLNPNFCDTGVLNPILAATAILLSGA